jgi:hypothetical protein
MRHACMLTLPKERGDVKTLLVVCVRYQARILLVFIDIIRSGVRILLVFIDTEFNHKRKDSEVD